MTESVDTIYDGRSFLSLVTDVPDQATTAPTYSSEGLLHCLERQEGSTEPLEKTYYFYLAGRPVAQLLTDGTTSTWTYLTTDHLGTPLMATNSAGDVIWQGPFEPFGRDWTGTLGPGQSALENDLYLRFPGQWDDGRWEDAASAASMYYNLARWYLDSTGSYGSVDPLGLLSAALDEGLLTIDHPYTYARSNFGRYTDPMGLKVEIENPDTADRYDQLKQCFPLFRAVAGYFERDTKWFGLADRVWTVKDPSFVPETCGQGGSEREIHGMGSAR